MMNPPPTRKSGLSPSLIGKLRKVWESCFKFDTHEELKRFVANREPIHIWAESIPEDNDAKKRFETIIDFFRDKWTAAGQNGLILFLEANRERFESDDMCFHDMQSLIEMTRREIGSPALPQNRPKVVEAQLRIALQKGVWDGVPRFLEELSQHSESYDTFVWGRKLLSVAELSSSDIFVDLQVCSVAWPDETICAYLAAHARFHALPNAANKNTVLLDALNKAYCILPVDSVSSENGHLLDGLAKISVPLQSRRWPPWEDGKVGEVPADLPPIRQFAQVLSQPATQWFMHRGSEEKKLPFWGKHSLYQSLANTSKSLFIYGPKGVGRTTLAEGIKYCVDNRTLFFCDSYLDLDIAKRKLVGQLYDFLLDHPTWLNSLNKERLSLLGRMIKWAHGDSVVKTLEYKIDSIERGKENWLPDDGNENRELWQIMSRTQLRRLKGKLSEPQNGENIELIDILRCAGSLGFDRILLIVDCRTRKLLTSVTYTVKKILDEIKPYPIYVLFFYRSCRNPVAKLFNMPPQIIQWEKSDLEEMVDSWYRIISTRDKVINYFSSEELWDKFLGRYQNPRELIRDLQRIISDFPGELQYGAITPDYLNQILGEQFS